MEEIKSNQDLQISQSQKEDTNSSLAVFWISSALVLIFFISMLVGQLDSLLGGTMSSPKLPDSLIAPFYIFAFGFFIFGPIMFISAVISIISAIKARHRLPAPVYFLIISCSIITCLYILFLSAISF